MSYQKITGSLMANSHPGSYCGQDAYSDMLVTENEHNDVFFSEKRRIQGVSAGVNRISETIQRCDRFSCEGGGWNEMNGASKTVVRRLTPLECERLQGFPDNWTLIGEWDEEKQEYFYIGTDGKRKKVSDSARYKALGNSICTPYWFQLLRKISAQYERPSTLGSLFDGIGGFPYCWEKCNGEGTAIWASEIEEFPIAVTKKHFPEKE